MRETFMVKLTQVGKKIKDGEQRAASSPILIMSHNIDAIIPNEKGSTILMGSGVAYEVQESPEEIGKKGTALGTMRVF